jgi:hypothetical protein
MISSARMKSISPSIYDAPAAWITPQSTTNAQDHVPRSTRSCSSPDFDDNRLLQGGRHRCAYLTDGGPNNATSVIAVLLLQAVFWESIIGRASARAES